MKKAIFLITLIFYCSTIAQDNLTSPIFSKFNFSILGGTNFNSTSSFGSAFKVEVTTNILPKLNAKLSAGYSTFYNDNSYSLKSYKFVHFDGYQSYHTLLTDVDRIRYSVIPIRLGTEYMINNGVLSPFASLDLGYNIYRANTEGTTKEGIAGRFDTISEIPLDYRNPQSSISDGSGFVLSAGFGLKYQLSTGVGLLLRYNFNYNKSTINYNQLLFGIIF